MTEKITSGVARAISSLVLLILISGFGNGPASARAGAYLLDVVRTEPYRGAWTRMLAKEHDVPGWIADFAVTGNGVNTPSKMVPVGYRAFTFATLCKPHDCADNMLYVFFAPDGAQAFAKLVEAGKTPRIFGKPDAPTASALEEAIAASGRN
ncbi:MAG: hypothetical protein JO172_01695 [Hyphomicrobiales bacterium]|nr:hypothetical protein [Hyphomicrobiales bacterium]